MEDVDRAAAVPSTAERVAALLNRLRAQIGDAGGGLPRGAPGGMSAADVDAMAAYFLRQGADHPGIVALGAEYWQYAAELAEHLPVQGRAVLFSVLWGETPQLTVLCVRLLQALEALGNPERMCCELDALDGQAGSIVDVETMMQGLEDESAAKLTLSTVDGELRSMTRPLVTALAAELHLTLEEQSFGFLSNADLLDFPGAPARSRFTEPDSLFADPTNRARHFRRGKAAYLFHRYVEHQELAALVLCMEDAPPTARTLPTMVQGWIDTVQGASPDERGDMPCALFVALTKFDQDLKEELRQKEDDPEHWAHRLNAVFDDFLCRESRWAERWAPGRPFSNVFWVRNPIVAEPEVLQYNASGRETGLVDRGRIARLRGRFIATPQVKQHFADPGRAWDEVLKLNDGGVSYLAGQLRPICDPEQRRRQVGDLLATLARDMHQCLEPFYVAATPARATVEDTAVTPEPARADAVQETAPRDGDADAAREDVREPAATPRRADETRAEDRPAPVRAAANDAAPGGLNIRMLAIAAVVVIAIIGGAVALFSGGGRSATSREARSECHGRADFTGWGAGRPKYAAASGHPPGTRTDSPGTSPSPSPSTGAANATAPGRAGR